MRATRESGSTLVLVLVLLLFCTSAAAYVASGLVRESRFLRSWRAAQAEEDLRSAALTLAPRAWETERHEEPLRIVLSAGQVELRAGDEADAVDILLQDRTGRRWTMTWRASEELDSASMHPITKPTTRRSHRQNRYGKLSSK